VDQKAISDVQLKLGASTTDIVVHATAPLLDRNSAEMATVVGQTQIASLPVKGRNRANLLVLASLAIDDGGGNQQRSIRFSGRARYDNNYCSPS
jgi:hypothetical protein